MISLALTSRTSPQAHCDENAAKPCGVALHETQAAFDDGKIRLTVKTMISLALTSRTCPQARCDEIVRGISFDTSG